MHKVSISERYSFNGPIYEVVADDEKYVHLSSVVGQHRRSLTHFQFGTLIEQGQLKKTQSAPIDVSKAPLLLNMTELERAAHERKVRYVVEALNILGNSLPREKVKAFITQHAKDTGDLSPPSYSTLYIWASRYRAANNSPLGLIKDKHLKLPRGKNLPEDSKAIIEQIINEHYMTREKLSGQMVYNLVVNRINIDNANRPAGQKIQVPARATFYRVLTKLDPFVTNLLREGREYAEKRNKYPSAIAKPARRFQRMEADTQCLDVIVLDELGNVLGRPYLTAIMECLTRVIVGWELSMTPPCAEKTLKALRMSLSSENPNAGMGDTYYIDNGSEFINESVFGLLSHYGAKVVPLPPGKPDQKPHIERFFGTLNTGFSHTLRGTTRSNPTDRRDYDSEKYAYFTLETIQHSFEKWVSGVYHERKHASLGTSPIARFRKLAETEYPSNRYAPEELALTCRKSKARVITNGRVSLFNLSWSGPGLPRMDDKARRLGVKPIVHYDESDLGRVWVSLREEPGVMLPADATDPQYQNGLTLHEHQLTLAALEEQGEAYDGYKAIRALSELYFSMNQESDFKSRKGKTKKATNKNAVPTLGNGVINQSGPFFQPFINQTFEFNDDDFDTIELE